MTDTDPQRLRRRRVKQAVATCLAAGALAAPLAWLLVAEDPLSVPQREAAATAPKPQLPAGPPHQVAPPSLPVKLSPKRAHVQQLASAKTSHLERLALGSEPPAERLAALTLLWERGEVDRVRALAQGDRLLSAKLKALEAARPAPTQTKGK